MIHNFGAIFLRVNGALRHISLRGHDEMSSKEAAVVTTTIDKRMQILSDEMKRHNYTKDSLLEILHKAHELYGYFDKDLLLQISKSLRLPPSHVYGVATFYNLFKLVQPGDHVVTFCMGTACYVRGVEQILGSVEKGYNIKRGETSSDRRLSVFVTRCIGCCAMAPNVIVDEEVIGKATTEQVVERIRQTLEEKKE